MNLGLLTTVTKFRADSRQRRRRCISRVLRLLEKRQHHEEHQEHAQRRHAKHIFHAHVVMHVRRQIRPRRAANIHQRVVDRISDRPHILFRRARRRPHHARLHQRHAQRRQRQHARNQHSKRQRPTQRREPWRPNRSQHEIRAGQNEVRQRKRAPESQPVRHRSAKRSEEPHQPAEKSRQRPDLLRGKVQRLA